MKMNLFTIILSAFLAVCCKSYDDSAINDRISKLEQRVAALEEQCNGMNGNIASLKTVVEAIGKKEFVTGVNTLEDGSGYTISFSSGKTVTVRNGSDGKTPLIGVKKGSDGTYYWTIDGEWIVADGKKIKAESVTPKFKIENDYWYVSYDDAATWLKLGKALETPEAKGCYIFKNISVNGDSVRFVLQDGTVFNVPLKVLSPDFDESQVVLSLAVVSDVHINGSNTAPYIKFGKALEQLKAKAAEKDADGLDGVLVAGDLIDYPSQTQIAAFKSVYESKCDPLKVPLVYTIGNHDVPNYRWSSTMVADAKYLVNAFGPNYFLKDKDNTMREEYECRHVILGDRHILTITPNGTQPVVYDPNAVNWLDNKLREITEADPYSYVIVLTHPMIQNTVYGSKLGVEGGIWESTLPNYWATAGLTSILNKYPQAVVFGGHLHFPLNDPRSIWQEGFTVLGCGSVRYMAIENGGYEGMSGETVMTDKDEFSQGNLLQFDANGNMRVFRMDFYNDGVIGGAALELSHPAADLSHLRKYSHSSRSARNNAPALSDLDVMVNPTDVSVTFSSGTDDEFVHHYVLTLKKNGVVNAAKKILADFYRHALTSEMKPSWKVSLGSLEEGNYDVSLVAYDSWGAASNVINKSFKVSEAKILWVPDEAGSRPLQVGEATVTSDWLSYNSGTLSWSANTTGNARTASIDLPDGTYYITQIGPLDFKGTYSFASKVFSRDGFVAGASKGIMKTLTGITVGAPLKGETLTDGAGKSHTNQLGVRGLYHSGIVADACAEIDYENKTAKFGLFLDARKAQIDAAIAGTYKYIAFLPETCATLNETGFYKPWFFTNPDLGTPDYEWIWFDVSADFNVFDYNYRKAQTLTSTNPNSYGPYIIGITVASFNAEDATLANSAAGSSGAYTNTIYQFNDPGLVFTKQ